MSSGDRPFPRFIDQILKIERNAERIAIIHKYLNSTSPAIIFLITGKERLNFKGDSTILPHSKIGTKAKADIQLVHLSNLEQRRRYQAVFAKERAVHVKEYKIY